jgi:hypothetical protein
MFQNKTVYDLSTFAIRLVILRFQNLGIKTDLQLDTLMLTNTDGRKWDILLLPLRPSAGLQHYDTTHGHGHLPGKVQGPGHLPGEVQGPGHLAGTVILNIKKIICVISFWIRNRILGTFKKKHFFIL